MRPVLLMVVLALTIGIALATLLGGHSGYVLITLGEYAFETSVVTFVIFVLVLGSLMFLVYELVRWLMSSHRGPKSWFASWGSTKARRLTNEGLIELAEGEWKKAEHLLARSAAKSDIPLINYLNAARAADELGESEKRDRYLANALEQAPDRLEIAVGLTQAQLQINNRQWEQALATLVKLREKAPKHVFVLKMLATVYEQVEDWQKLVELLTLVKKRKVLANGEFDVVEKRAYQNLIQHLPKASQPDGVNQQLLMEAWNAMPRGLKKDSQLLNTYARTLIQCGGLEEAGSVIAAALKKEWDDSLIDLYGHLELNNPLAQLVHAEQWTRSKPNNPTLLLALGRISIRANQPEKARQYFESSLQLKLSAEASRELGLLLNKQGQFEKSAQLLQQSLTIVERTQGTVLALT